MTQFEPFYKQLALNLSDHIASQLKISIQMTHIEFKHQPFNVLLEQLPDFNFTLLFEENNQPILFNFDLPIIYALADRMLGGDGIVTKRPEHILTSSESLFSSQLSQDTKQLYLKLNKPVELTRCETKKEQCQCFFPDQQLQVAQIQCTLNQKELGLIHICHKFDPLNDDQHAH